MKRIIILIGCILILTGCSQKTLEEVVRENKYKLSEITNQYNSVDGLKKASAVSNLDFRVEILNFTDSDKADKFVSNLKDDLQLKTDEEFLVAEGSDVNYLVLVIKNNVGFSKIPKEKIKDAKEVLKIVTDTQ